MFRVMTKVHRPINTLAIRRLLLLLLMLLVVLVHGADDVDNDDAADRTERVGPAHVSVAVDSVDADAFKRSTTMVTI